MLVSRYIAMLALLAFPLSLAAQEEQPEVNVPPVTMKDSTLLVYSSGEPYETIHSIKDPSLLDAISSPTPKERNTAQVAKMIYDHLSGKGKNVRMARVEDFGKEDWREVMAYRTIILGSPARFWNISWEMKRFIDLIFGRIYIHPDRGRNTQFAIFSTAEIEPSARDCLDAMARMLQDNNGPVVARLNLHLEQTDDEFQAAVDKFCSVMGILAH